MFSGTAKFQTRPASPQFTNFAAPGDYPLVGGVGQNAQTAAAAVVHSVPSGMNTVMPGHNTSMLMRHPKTSSAPSSAVVSAMTSSKPQRNTGGAPIGGSHHLMSGASTMGHHRGDMIFPDDMDSIEFCMPPPPAPSNGIAHGINGELLLIHGDGPGATGPNGICEAFTERRRRGHSRRSNHKMDVEQQVKWSRKNIAATMERFEPTAGTHSSSSTSSLEYGFAAGVITPTALTPSRHHTGGGGSGHSPAPPPTHVFNGAAAAGAPFNHVYSYAYYEPGAAKCHTNIPHKDGLPVGAASVVPPPTMPGPSMVPGAAAVAGPSKSPPRNSIRALLAKSFRSKSSSNSGQSTSSSPSTEDRHTYTTRYGTTENLYEEVNEQKIRKVLSDNRIATSSVGNVKEELRRVQHNHFRVLDELNLSLEALIMPSTPPDVSPNHEGDEEDDGPTTNAAAGIGVAAAAHVSGVAATPNAMATEHRSQRGPRRGGLLGGAASSSSSTTSSQQRTLSHASLDNLSTTLHSMELKDHAHSSSINPEFDEGDLDSGFSGSGSSSGASYNESLRYYKTGTNHHLSTPHGHHNQHHNHHHNVIINNNNNNQMQTTTLPLNLRSCRSSTASGTSTSKSSMVSCDDQGIVGVSGMGVNIGMPMMSNVGGCGAVAVATSPFNYPRRCSDTQRTSARSISASGATATGTKPKKNFWTIKP